MDLEGDNFSDPYSPPYVFLSFSSAPFGQMSARSPSVLDSWSFQADHLKGDSVYGLPWLPPFQGVPAARAVCRLFSVTRDTETQDIFPSYKASNGSGNLWEVPLNLRQHSTWGLDNSKVKSNCSSGSGFFTVVIGIDSSNRRNEMRWR